MDFLQAQTLESRRMLMRELASRFKSRAEQIDRKGEFPFENIDELKNARYTALTVPRRYGGAEISLRELICLQEELAIGDGSTSLSIGWHLGIVKNLSEKRSWNEDVFHHFCKRVMEGALVNGAATEPSTGSPTRGGMPQTKAVKDGDHWVLVGRKTFTTMAPALDYFIVSAEVEGSGKAANFLVPRSADGVAIEHTWDSVSMRGTGSHDLVLNQAKVAKEHLVEWLNPGKRRANGWLLHIPACYLGIAQAAQNEAIQFAKNYTPNSLKGPIIELPNIQSKIGEMELELMRARTFLYAAAEKWDQSDEAARDAMTPELGAVKMAVTNAAIHIVDLAMRVVGAHSLSLSHPLQRYYRDVRAGLHNPPMDDMTIQQLANAAIQRTE